MNYNFKNIIPSEMILGLSSIKMINLSPMSCWYIIIYIYIYILLTNRTNLASNVVQIIRK